MRASTRFAFCAIAILVARNTSAVTFGETAQLPETSGGNANILFVQGPSALPQRSTILSMSIYVVSPAGNIRLGFYDDTGPGGGPGQLKGQTAPFAAAAGWNTHPLSGPLSVPAGNYWPAALASASGLVVAATTTPGPISGRHTAFAYALMPLTFPAGPATTPLHLSLYGEGHRDWRLIATVDPNTASCTVTGVPIPIATVQPVGQDCIWDLAGLAPTGYSVDVTPFNSLQEPGAQTPFSFTLTP